MPAAPMDKGPEERASAAPGSPSERASEPSVPSPLAEMPAPSREARDRAAARSGGFLARALTSMAETSFEKLLGVWVAIVVGCGLLYWLIELFAGTDLVEGTRAVPSGLGGLLTSIYFSFVTATSIGFGDVVPLGPARIIAILEGASGLLILGLLISKLVSRRQDDLIEETHQIAYEVRLGRVRTNLHLVLSEMHNMASELRTGTRSPEVMLPRLESTVMVFGGEMRTIHDLLYRPQLLPDESVVEPLLAGLASSMRSLDDIVREFPRLRDQSSILRSGVSTIAKLANEICVECVPRDHAPELQRWIDLVQSLAGRLETEAAPAA